MSVVGFDFGTSKCVVSVARNRGIDVLQNEVGMRVTPTVVAFSGKQRYIGTEALAQHMSNPKGTVSNFKRLLGRKADESEIPIEKQFCTAAFRPDPQTGMLEIEVPYDDQIQTFSPEQITAAMFTKLKAIAEAGLEGARVTDCCIACPSYFTEMQRRAMLDAAAVAGLNVLKLLNETTAVALNYGILRPLPKDKHNYVCFYDMGLTATNVSLVAFSEGKLKVLGQASDRHLGGRNFDMVLVDYFVKMIKEKYKMDVTTNVKSMLKLRKECERVKLQLSANSKVQFSVEYIMNDTDVSAVIDRSDFEAILEETLILNLTKPIESVLAQANLKKEDLHSIEIVGGSVRIPLVQKTLCDFFGRDVSKTCDGDESIARGCALMCAMISPSFRVKEFEVQDASMYPIELAWGKSSNNDFQQEDKTEVFLRNNPIPSVKMISFTDRQGPLTVIARYAYAPDLPPSTNPILGRWIIHAPQIKGSKIKLRAKLDTHGCLQVASAQMLTEEIVEQQPHEDKMDTSAAESQKPDGPTETPQNEAEKMDTSADNTQKEQPKEKGPKVRTKREDLKIDSFGTAGASTQQLSTWLEKEAQMAMQDRAIFETNEARNALEAYVLEMRNRLSGDLAPYVKDVDRDKLAEQCNAAEDWVYSVEAQKSEYKAKLNELKQIGDQIVHRHYQAENRNHHVSLLKGAIGHYQNWAQNNKDEKYAHITPEERQKLLEECKNIDQWLTEQLVAQDKHPKHENPLLTIEHLDAKKVALEKFASPIVNKPKPKPPAKKEDPKPEDMKNQSANQQQQSSAQNNNDEPQTNENAQPNQQQTTSPNKQQSAEQPSKSASPKQSSQKPMDTSA